MLAHGDALVQRFQPEVEEEGEWSLIFFDGKLSHAALKRPAAGDFRVQEQFGGSARAATPSAGLIAQASAALRAGEALAGARTLYARVDGLIIEGRFHCLELEVIEPSLFLALDPEQAPARLADAIAGWLARPRRPFLSGSQE